MRLSSPISGPSFSPIGETVEKLETKTDFPGLSQCISGKTEKGVSVVNFSTKGTFLGCQLAPEMISIAPNLLFELYADNKHATQNITSEGSFLGLAKPHAKIRKFRMGVHFGTLIHV